MTLNNLKTPPCVVVSKRVREGAEGKKYHFIGVVEDSGITGELAVSEDLYKRISSDHMYKKYILSVSYNDSPKYGSYLTVNDFSLYQEPQTGKAKTA